VKTTDIYWGAVPFLIIQVLMVATVLAFPSLVGVDPVKLDDTPVEIELEAPDSSYFPPQEKP